LGLTIGGTAKGKPRPGKEKEISNLTTRGRKVEGEKSNCSKKGREFVKGVRLRAKRKKKVKNPNSMPRNNQHEKRILNGEREGNWEGKEGERGVVFVIF